MTIIPFIFDVSHKWLSTLPTPEETCVRCNHKGALETNFFQKYFHLLWIPMFPVGKTFLPYCNQCKKNFRIGRMTEVSRLKAEAVIPGLKTPKFVYTGLIILGFLIGFFIFAGIMASREQSSHPQNTQMKNEAPQP